MLHKATPNRAVKGTHLKYKQRGYFSLKTKIPALSGRKAIVFHSLRSKQGKLRFVVIIPFSVSAEGGGLVFHPIQRVGGGGGLVFHPIQRVGKGGGPGFFVLGVPLLSLSSKGLIHVWVTKALAVAWERGGCQGGGQSLKLPPTMLRCGPTNIRHIFFLMFYMFYGFSAHSDTLTGMPMGTHEKRATSFCDKRVCL